MSKSVTPSTPAAPRPERIKITDNFFRDEFTRNNHGIIITPTEQQWQNITDLCTNTLQPISDILRLPITVNSGIRNEDLNRIVGGSKGSDHVPGRAADITCSDNLRMFLVAFLNVPFDQLIVVGELNRPRFLHISFRKNQNRLQVLHKVVNGRGVISYNPIFGSQIKQLLPAHP